MKISIVSLNNDKRLSQITDAILRISYDIKVSIYSKDYDKKNGSVKMTAQVDFAKTISDCIKESDIIFNLISRDDKVLSILNKYNDTYPVDMSKALFLQDLVGYFKTINDLDEFANYVQSSEVPIINISNSPDIVTLYLYRSHNIISYGLNYTAYDTIPQLLKDINLDLDLEMLRGKLVGIDKLVWLTDIRDDKGRDLYPTLREYNPTKKIDIKREELTRNALESMAFYGYYHSGDLKADNIGTIVERLVNNYVKSLNNVFYLNVINNDAIKDIGKDIPIVTACKVSGKSIVRQDISLPIPLMLAMSDMVSSMSLVVSSLISQEYDMFLRTIKLDSYLMSILTLDELDELAKSIIMRFNLSLKDKE